GTSQNRSGSKRKVGLRPTPVIPHSPSGNGSCCEPVVPVYIASSLSCASYALSQPSDLSTTTLVACGCSAETPSEASVRLHSSSSPLPDVRSMPKPTLGTRTSCPGRKTGSAASSVAAASVPVAVGVGVGVTRVRGG